MYEPNRGPALGMPPSRSTNGYAATLQQELSPSIYEGCEALIILMFSNNEAKTNMVDICHICKLSPHFLLKGLPEKLINGRNNKNLSQFPSAVEKTNVLGLLSIN